MTLIGNVLATREKLRERFTSQEEIEDDGRQGNEADIISAEDRAFIDRLRKYIEDNISETSISITSLAGEMCMSRASFFRKMKSLTGMTPNDFILTYRVNKAAAMLREGKWRGLARSRTCWDSVPPRISQEFSARDSEKHLRSSHSNSSSVLVNGIEILRQFSDTFVACG